MAKGVYQVAETTGGEGGTEVAGSECGGHRASLKSQPWFYVSIFFSFLITCTLGFNYCFGNMTPYLTSYLRAEVDGSVDYTWTLWISQTTPIVACLTMPLVGALVDLMPLRLYMFIGIVTNAASMFGTYWGVQASFWGVWFTYGVLYGLPAAFLYPACVKICTEWLPERKGLITGIILMGYGSGNFMWTALTTWYINPDNLTPDTRTQQDVYYSKQQPVLERVPSCFLVLGTVFVSVQLVCLVLIRRPPHQAKMVTTITVEAETSLTSDQSKTTIIDSGRKTPLYGTHDKLDSSFLDKRMYNKYESEKLRCSDSQESSKSDKRPEYTWRMVLKSRVFWTFWGILFLAQIGVGFFIPLYKAFGQTFIPDDHYLTQVAMAASIANAAGRPFWGSMADRFGIKNTALIVQVLLAVLVVTFTSCRDTGRLTFALWVCCMFLAACGLFTLIPIFCLTAFGPKHFFVNLGVLDTHAILGCFAPALIATPLKAAFGWSGMFLVSFIALFIGILLNMSFDCFKNGKSIPPHMLTDLGI